MNNNNNNNNQNQSNQIPRCGNCLGYHDTLQCPNKPKSYEGPKRSTTSSPNTGSGMSDAELVVTIAVPVIGFAWNLFEEFIEKAGPKTYGILVAASLGLLIAKNEEGKDARQFPAMALAFNANHKEMHIAQSPVLDKAKRAVEKSCEGKLWFPDCEIVATVPSRKPQCINYTLVVGRKKETYGTHFSLTVEQSQNPQNVSPTSCKLQYEKVKRMEGSQPYPLEACYTSESVCNYDTTQQTPNP